MDHRQSAYIRHGRQSHYRDAWLYTVDKKQYIGKELFLLGNMNVIEKHPHSGTPLLARPVSFYVKTAPILANSTWSCIILLEEASPSFIG